MNARVVEYDGTLLLWIYGTCRCGFYREDFLSLDRVFTDPCPVCGWKGLLVEGSRGSQRTLWEER